MQNIFIDILPPWVETGLQPAFYDLESGTVLQQTARMYAKVRELTTAFNQFSEDVSNEINSFEQETNDEIERFEQATNDEIERFEGVINDTVEEYIGKFNELHDYVEDYFENLDVQEEINNKLDEMVEDGVLQEIITTYIQSNVAWTFDNVAEMQSATNLIDGSYAMTLGYHTIDDGGGALYKITDTQPVSGHYETLSGNLYASLVYDGTIKPCQYGAYHDGIHDDSDVLQECLNELHNHVYFVLDLQGYHYWTAKPLYLNATYRATIKNGEINALDTFVIDSEDDEHNFLLYTNPKSATNYNPPSEVYGTVGTEDLKVLDVTFDCKYVAGLGCFNLRNYIRANVNQCIFRRYLTVGIKTVNDESHELVLTDCTFNAYLARPAETNTTATSIQCDGYDNIYSNIIITGGKYAIKMTNAQANMFSKIHAYGYSDYFLYSDSSSQNTFDELYVDGRGMYMKNPWLTTFVNCYFLTETTPFTLVRATANSYIRGLKIIGCMGRCYAESAIDLLTFPDGQFHHYTDCEFDIKLNSTNSNVNDNTYLASINYKTNFNKVFADSSSSTIYGLNSDGSIFNVGANNNYTYTAVNNIVNVTAYNSAGYSWLGFGINLEKNKTYKIINHVNNTPNMRVYGYSSLAQGSAGTLISDSLPNKYGYITFNSGNYDHYMIAFYNKNRWEPEISEVVTM